VSTGTYTPNHLKKQRKDKISTFNKTFGIELEIAGISQAQALEALNSAGINAKSEYYTHEARGYWKLVDDSSVRDGFEVVSPILHGQVGLEEALKAAKALDEAGTRVNKTCGFHAYFDANNLSIEEIRTIATRYATFEDEIDAFMPNSRRADNNTYCKSTKNIFLHNSSFTNADNITDMVNAQGSRYFKLNLQSYSRHHTIEFRQHSGTINTAKIENWLCFLHGFIDESCRIARGTNTENLPTLQKAQQDLINKLTRSTQGETAEALQQSLNILPHSLRASICYLRRKGISISTTKLNGKTAYSLPQSLINTPDHLFAGIAAGIENFYAERACDLAA
jgi:hypothetical protein